MANSSQRGRNLISLYLFIDTNTLIGALHRNTEADEAARELFRLWETGWIGLARTDTMDTERFEGQDAETRAQREEEAAGLPEAYGPFVFDHSRFDASVFASGEDTTRVEDVFAIVFPTKDVSTARKNEVRDAMHVATAARYGGHAFVTNDGALLRKDREIAELLGIRVWSPEQALTEVKSRVAARRRLHELEPDRGPLPAD